MHCWLFIYNSRWTVVEGDSNAPFLIASTPGCRGRHYNFLWIAPLTLELYLLMLGVKRGIKYHFWVFGMIHPGIKHWSPGPLVNILTIMSKTPGGLEIIQKGFITQREKKLMRIFEEQQNKLRIFNSAMNFWRVV